MRIVESVFEKLKGGEEERDRIELEEGVIYHGDVLEKLPLVEKESVDLCFTSPPYNIGKKYGGNGREDMRDWEEYVEWSVKWIGEIYRVLKKKGFFVLNIPMSILQFRTNLKTSLPMGAIFTEVCLKTGFEYYGTVIILLFFRKNEGSRSRQEKEIEFFSPADGINCAWGIWHITPELKNRMFHPAPFPYELAYRVVKLCTNKSETVLDPFMGLGTTPLVCIHERRRFVGIEKERKYIDLFLLEYKLHREKRKLLY